MDVYQCVATDYLIRMLAALTHRNNTIIIIIGLDEIEDGDFKDALIKIKSNRMFLPICMFLNIVIEDTASSHTKRSHRGGSPYHNIIALLLFLCLNSIVANIMTIKPSPIKRFQQKLKDVFQQSKSKNMIQNIQDAFQKVDTQIEKIINIDDFASQLLSLSERGEMHKYIEMFNENKKSILGIFSIVQKKLNIANTLLETIKTGKLKPITEELRSKIQDKMTEIFITSASDFGSYINIMITMIKELPENMESLTDHDKEEFTHGRVLGGKTKKRRHRRCKSLRRNTPHS